MKISSLGIIAGNGQLPAYLVDYCLSHDITPYLVGFKGQTNEDLMNGHHHLWTHMGYAGKIINFFKSNGVKDVVMIGGVKRPSFSNMKTDMRGLKILSKLTIRALGDNDVLSVVKEELESDGLTVHGIHDFCETLLVEEGLLGKYAPKDEDTTSIQRGIVESQTLGAQDLGQSAVVQNGELLGVEDIEGTDALITKCAPHQQKGRGAILVKTCKPQQDKKLDLPTIGVETIKKAGDAGFAGIVVEAKNALLVDPKEVARLADHYKMFVLATALDKYKNIGDQ